MRYSPSSVRAFRLRSFPLSHGFTILEMLVAMSIFILLLVVFTGITNMVYKGWETAKRQTEISQNARAILTLIEQDLTPALISKEMQFGQNPPLSGKLPSGQNIVTNGDSLFWYAPTTASPQPGYLSTAQFGWYLSTQSDPQGQGSLYNINRLCRRISITDPAFVLPGTADTPNRVYWFNGLYTATGEASLAQNARVVSNTVLGFWVECLDKNGNVIPPRSYNAGVPRFNSAERFQSAPAGQTFEGNKTFQYTGASTLQANQLPSAVRISIMITDERTLKRKPSIPALPVITDVTEIASQIEQYREDLINDGIFASIFTTTVKLANAP